MKSRIFNLAVASGALLVAAGEICFARSIPSPFSDSIKHAALPVRPMASASDWQPAGSLSPDGRWLAYFDSQPKNREKIVFYDLIKARHWTPNAGRSASNLSGMGVLSWRPDSRACAIGASDGWRVVWPHARKAQRISRSEPGDEGCAAWSPRTKRLAIFEGASGSGLYRVWNGKRLTKGIVWRKAVEYPFEEGRAWQCEWSPDEKLILFRFYGHAMRDSHSAGHTAVLNPRTGRPRFDWGAEAGPARWLDPSRLVFAGDYGGAGVANGLTVARPVARQSNEWLKEALTWTLSPRRDAIWALTKEGHLYKTPAHKQDWQLIRRNAVSTRVLRVMSPSLFLSPRGDMIAFCEMFGGSSISILSTSTKRPWTISWRAPAGKVQVLGWASGKSLPLLEWQRKEAGPGSVIQLTK